MRLFSLQTAAMLGFIGSNGVAGRLTAMERRAAAQSADAICSMDINDPATFDKSGATAFLNDFLKSHGTDDWLNNMDKVTTSGGIPNSNLHCQGLGGNTCQPPTVECKFFTPPELFYIRVAATNIQNFFTACHETLQNVAIDNVLSVDQIVSDFGPNPTTESDPILALIFKLVGPGFSMSDKVIKQQQGLGKRADAFGFIGGLFSATASGIILASQSDPPEVSIATLTQNAENLLKTIFDNSQKGIEALNSQIFGGSPNPSVDLNSIISLAASATGVTPDSSLEPIAQVFSTGTFLQVTDQSALTDGVSAGFQLIRQQLAIGVLAAQNYFVFVNTDRSPDDCNKITGARFINNQCFTFEMRTPNNVNCEPDSAPIDPNLIKKFDDPNAGYNFDVNAFYQNVADCNNGQPATSIDIGGDLPKCAFQIPFIKASGSPCNVGGDRSVFPSALKLTPDGCTKSICKNPKLFSSNCPCN